MHRRLLVGWVWKMFIVCMAIASGGAFGANLAGSVSFVIGESNVVDAEGKIHQVLRGDEIQVGQTLQTGPSGHIHMRMVDGAFISVRPQSRLRIEDYRYDPAVAANNRIRFVLEQGVARSITGRAGEASRENYRLNTPLAAIGIRGTDFVVQVATDITRVTVQSGAVVMSPLANDCLASTQGPCKSASSRVLTAAMRDAYLELRGRYDAPKLVPAGKALESPNLLSPPRPEEPRVTSDKLAKANANVDSHDAVREVAVDTIKSRVDATTVVPDVSPTTPVVAPPVGVPVVPVVVAPVVPVVVPEVIPAAKYWWGRYAAFLQPGEEASSIAVLKAVPGRETTVGNEVFNLLREKGNVVMPGTGVAKFQLAESEVYVLRDHKTLTIATVSAPSLTVDFGAGSYQTALTVNGGGLSPVLVESSGRVNWQGELKASSNSPTGTQLYGSLAGNADQAGYVFQSNIQSGVSVVGATRWYR